VQAQDASLKPSAQVDAAEALDAADLFTFLIADNAPFATGLAMNLLGRLGHWMHSI